MRFSKLHLAKLALTMLWAVALSSLIAAADARAADASGKPEKSELVLAYPQANLALKPEQLQTWFSYLDDKDYPQAAKANPADYYDNSFVVALEKSGFFRKLTAPR